MTMDLETRRRRAAYRAAHRGTREMDWLMGRYADEKLPQMDDAELTRFEQFLAIPDPELQKWLMAPNPPPSDTEFLDLIKELRAFHKVEGSD